ncbi:uncharacterized protein LOC132704924 isoform X2 [Cylas formicarius]|nr:uncharacterized protein LOC132704924 isoform X2 [Cylas formicarius]
MHILFALFQNSFHYLVVESKKHWSMKIVTHLLRRFYTYVFLWVTVLHWRGGWLLTEYYTNLRFTKELKATKETSLICLLVGAATFLILLCMRCLRNAIAPPFALCLDKRNYVFRFPTMFSPNIKFGWLRVLDCVISVGVVGNLVVVLWRAIWVAVDLVVIPQNFTCSAWACLVLGLIATGLVFRLQNCMKRVCTDLSGIIKVILADAYILLSIIAAILFWSGIWNLLNIYFLPGDLLLSCTLSHLISLAFLYLIGCSNSLLVRGVMQDGSGEEGECVVFPCNYLRTIFEQERTACLGQLGLTEENSAS